MFKPLALFIGLRYTKAKRRNHFISFISLASMIGIAIGVTVLITVLSVMNGFDHQIRTRFFAIAPQVTVMTSEDISKSWPKWQGYIKKLNNVTGVAPYVTGKGIILSSGQAQGLQIVGIDPKLYSKVAALKSKIVEGSLDSLTPGKFNIVIGQTLATQLGVAVGDKINVLTPQATITLAGIFPRYRSFAISGIFHASTGFGFDRSVAYISMKDAARLFPVGQRTSGFYLRLSNLYLAGSVTKQLFELLPPMFTASNWMQQSGAFFQALNMEKTILFVILILIIAVAAFNLVATLVMVVNDKRSDIAILRTLGASRSTIMAIFIVLGAVIGFIGTALGLVFGLVLSANITSLTNYIQKVFHIQFVHSSVYYIDYLPSLIQVSDVIHVCVIAFALSLLATLYPAWTAFRTHPAEALRYE